MKIKKIAALALIGLGFTASQAYAGGATTGQIELYGRVDASTCTITGLTVGTSLNPKTSQIQVSGCPANGNVEALFIPMNADTGNGQNKLSNSGTATGIDIGPFDGTDTTTAIAWNTPATTVIADGSGNATLKYTAAYVPTLTTAGPGNVLGTVQYQLNYN